MPRNLMQRIDTRSGLGMANKRFVQGTVLSLNEVTHTCVLDVGAILPGNEQAQYITVPYNPHNPPTLGDTQVIGYASSHPQSWYIAGGVIGGQNVDGTIAVGAGVASLAVDGEAKLQADITLHAGDATVMTQDGQNITIGVDLEAIESGVVPQLSLRIFFGG